MIRGHNNDLAYEHSLNPHLEFYSKAGSLRTGKKSYYGGETTALALFQQMWCASQETQSRLDALKLLFWLRDCRTGAGNRSGFRAIIRWLADETSGSPTGLTWLRVNLEAIPRYGRWDDLKALFGTAAEELAARLWGEAIARQSDALAAKWAKAHMVPLQKAVGAGFGSHVNEAKLRKVINHARNGGFIVERPMSANTWVDIPYGKVPGVAMARYTNAFQRHDPDGFAKFTADVKSGKQKVHATTLFPHDCALTARNGQADMADLQFEALPDYIGGGKKIMVLADTSGSMHDAAPGDSEVMLLDIAVALALYCSDRLGPTSPFYRKYMEFESEPKLVDWTGQKFSEQVQQRGGYAGSTDIQAALDQLLSMATMFRVPKEEMITTLLIVSDMQFDAAAWDEKTYESVSGTVVEQCMKRWEEAGYARPLIVYWNMAGYTGQPATATTPNTVLVSGFSPSVLKDVLQATEPIFAMRNTIERYSDIVTPALSA